MCLIALPPSTIQTVHDTGREFVATPMGFEYADPVKDSTLLFPVEEDPEMDSTLLVPLSEEPHDVALASENTIMRFIRECNDTLYGIISLPDVCVEGMLDAGYQYYGTKECTEYIDIATAFPTELVDSLMEAALAPKKKATPKAAPKRKNMFTKFWRNRKRQRFNEGRAQSHR